MKRKLLILAAALVGGLLFNVWIANAATSLRAQGKAAATHRTYLPLAVNSAHLVSIAASSPTPTPTASPVASATPSSTPSPTATATRTRTPTPSEPSVYTGVTMPGVPWNMAPLIEWEQNVAGKGVSIIQFWSFWLNGGVFQGFDRMAMDNIRNHGSIPMITWAPELAGVGLPDQPEFRLANIIAGQYDADIAVWADNARMWGHPFFLRFAHEPNGNWFPWGEDANGNQRGQYVQAWRHVHDLFTARGATNVTWVWCMNEDWAGSPRPSFASLYPGDEYVDWTCLDGYNWGTMYGGWRTFDGIFRYAYETLMQVAPSKPVMLGEWATVGTGGSAAGWISEAFNSKILEQYPKIRAEVWYNHVTNVDWRVEAWPGAPEALRAAVSTKKYKGAEFREFTESPIPAP